MNEKYMDLIGKIVLAVAIVMAASILADSFEILGDDINRGFSNLGSHVSSAAKTLKELYVNVIPKAG